MRTEQNGRRLLSRSFRCSARIGTSLPVHLAVGQCRTWEEAIHVASVTADVAGALRANGRQVYSFDPSRWKRVRPFTVVYPWAVPDEPNAHLSPFRLIGDWRLEAEDRGCIAMQYSPTIETMRAIASRVKANALLVDAHDPDGRLRVFHRAGMTKWDPITEEAFHARLIAGVDLGY